MVTTTMTLRSGAALPSIGLGTWGLSGDDGYRAVRTALDLGYRHIDTAPGYGNEAEIGRAVRDSGVDRSMLFLTTKIPPEKADDVSGTLSASLRTLGTDYLDLWLIHSPPPAGMGPRIWADMAALRDAEGVRAIGVSNYGPAQVDALVDATGIAPEVDQIPCHPLRHSPSWLAALSDRGVVVVGHSPLKRLDLTDSVLTTIAARYGVTAGSVVLHWHLRHGIAVIPKSGDPGRQQANLNVLDIPLTAGELAEVDCMSTRRALRTRRRDAQPLLEREI